MLPELEEKDANISHIASKALKDTELLSELFKGLLSKRDTYRFNCFEVLHLISKKNSNVLYPEWDFFTALLESCNTYHRLIAVRILANLTHADKEKKFEEIFKQYYNLLNDSVIVAGHLAACSGTIAKAKPELESKITYRLLNIEKTTQKHKDLVKAYAIDALNEYFNESGNKSEILQFVREALNSTSPKTRKKAKQFLETWS